jgi:ABC-type nitrate/sulfonate/bicarbonate transport system substrate-binding protein
MPLNRVSQWGHGDCALIRGVAMADKVSVGIVSRTFFYVPLWAGMANGVFASENLEVSIEILGNASQVPPLLDGHLHVFIGGPEPVLQNANAGGPLRIVAGNTGMLTHSLIAAPRFNRIEDMRGATIGILNRVEGTFFQLKEMMAAHGLHYPADYVVKETGGVPPRHKALLEGSIDAGLQSIPWNYAAEDAGFKSFGEVRKYVPDWQFVSVNANSDWAKSNGRVLVRFLRGLLGATQWVYANRAASAALAERELPTRRDYAERAWDHYTGTGALSRDMAINRKGLEKVIATQMEAGLLSEGASMSTANYVVDDYLRDARNSA